MRYPDFARLSIPTARSLTPLHGAPFRELHITSLCTLSSDVILFLNIVIFEATYHNISSKG